MSEYLDKFDKNLIYSYVSCLAGKAKMMEWSSDEEDSEKVSELRCKNCFYLIWFLYRYILGCETYEQACEYATEEILKKYKLYSRLHNNMIYIGVNKELDFYKVSDMKIILEILYHRYALFQQIECFMRHTYSERITVRYKRAKELKEKYIKVYLKTREKSKEGGKNW